MNPEITPEVVVETPVVEITVETPAVETVVEATVVETPEVVA
jgi:hypothetical protein